MACWGGLRVASVIGLGRLRSDSWIRVFTKDGQRTDTFTFDPVIASSWCSVSLRATTPCFETLYGPIPGGETSPATDAVFTIWQLSACLSMIGRNARRPWITPH